MEYGYITDPGKVRNHNEDSVIVTTNKMGEVLLAVADGMGGHKAGEVASSIAITHIGKRFSEISSVGTKEDAISFIKEIVSEANVLLYKYTSEHEESKGMGTTIVLAIKTKDFLLFGNIGDSSGYVIKNNKLHKVTKPHTLVNLLVEAGNITPEEALTHPKKNILMKALGVSEKCELDIFDVDIDSEAILLCSDGLTNMLSDDQIEKVLLDEELETEEKVDKLIKKCNARGGNDNISIAYLSRNGE